MSKLNIRRTISGKVYDTETAKEVMRLPIHVYGDDPKWEDTRLYLSPNGQWFLAGEGNGLSRWGVKSAGGYIPGEGLRLLSNEEAQALMEKFDGPVEDYFEVVEG